jgi:RHS repeat-associated protein
MLAADGQDPSGVPVLAALSETRGGGVVPQLKNAIEAEPFVSPTWRWEWRHFYSEKAAGELDQRYYSSIYGRFNTPDPYSASGGPSDPSSWNRYAYVGNDPANRFDPVGNDWWDPNTNTLYGDLGGGSGGGGGGGQFNPQPMKGLDPSGGGGVSGGGAPQGAGYAGYSDAIADLSKPDCTNLIAGSSGMNASQMASRLNSAAVTLSSDNGLGLATVVSTPNGDGSSTDVVRIKFGYTTGGKIYFNSNYFPSLDQKNITLSDGSKVSALQVENNGLGTNLSVAQMTTMFFLHELSHITGRPDDSNDTKTADDFNQNVVSKCLH